MPTYDWDSSTTVLINSEPIDRPAGGQGYYTVDNVTHPVVQEVDGSAYTRASPFTTTIDWPVDDDYTTSPLRAAVREAQARIDQELVRISMHYLMGASVAAPDVEAAAPREPEPLARRVRAYDLED